MCLQSQTMAGQCTFAFQSICKLEAIHFQLNSVASILPLGNDILQFLSSWDRLCFPTLWIRTDLISYFWSKECGKDLALVLSLDLKKSWLPLFFFSELCHCHENKLGPVCWRMSHLVQAELRWAVKVILDQSTHSQYASWPQEWAQLRSGRSHSDQQNSGAFSSVQFSCLVVYDSLRPHELQHARPPCPSPTPRVHSNLCPSSLWCHPAISSSVIPFFSCPQSLPAS